MHSDPNDFDSMPVGGAGARGAPMARQFGGGGVSAAGAAPAVAPKRQLIAEKLYKQQHTDDSYSRPSTARKRGGGLGGGGGPSSRPQLLMCYLCGQQFGTSSLHIHQPQCYVKKLLQWEKSPLVNRGPKPLSPDEFAAQSEHMDSPIMPGDAGAIDAFNNAQYKNYTEKMLVPCENCGRTFLPDRLPIHQRACKPGNAMRRVSASPARPVTAPRPEPAAAPRAIPEQAPRGAAGELVPCENCGRTFLPDRLPVHQKACKPGNAMRRVSASPARPSTSSGAANTKDRSPSPRMSEELGPTRRPRTSQREVPTLQDLDAAPASAGGAGSNGPSSPPIRAKPTGLSRLAGGPSTSELVPCQFCKRTFAPGRIEKHEGVCVERKTISTPAAGPSRVPKKSFPSVPTVGRHPSSSPARNVAPRVDSGLRARSPQAASREQQASSARAPVTPRGGARSMGAGAANPNSMIRKSPPPASQSQRAQSRPAYDDGATPPRSTSPSMAQLQASLDQITREIEQQKTADQSRTPRRSAVSPGYTPSCSPPPPPVTSASAAESCSSSVGASGPTPVRPMVLPRPDALPETDEGRRSTSVQSLGNASSSAPARPKFCFECGCKVPVSTAKFCGECGMRL